MNATPAVELRNVTKVFPGGIRAVDDVSLRIVPGRIVALLGPSGGGKTTTLRLINRLEDATSGQVLVRGEDVRRQRPERLRRSIGYVIQEGGLFPHLDVSDNVAIVPRLLGWPRTQVRRRVGEVLAMVGLPEGTFGRRLPAALSGGQRQRVGVARGLAADPDLLLMDEPFGALDPGTREGLQDEFLRLHAQLRKTVVLVTHDLAEAGKLAEEIVLLDAGRIVQHGPFPDLILRPAGERARSFLGRQGEGLALQMLRLRHVLEGLPVIAPSANPLRLSPDLRLGYVLAALAGAPDDLTVLVNGDAYSATSLRAIVVDDLAHAAPALGDPPMRAATVLTELLDAWERHQDTFWQQTAVFLSLVLRGLGLALLVGLPVGIVLSRLSRLAAPVIAVLGLLQTVPSLVLLGLLIPYLGIGAPPALFAAVVYSLFPIVMNTCVGIAQVPLPIRDAARGMGMTGRQVLWRVELPLAFPVVLAGIRTGAIYALGVVTVCAYIGAGGLGDYIFTGLSRQDNGLMWLGALPILILTLVLFWSLGGIATLAQRNSTLGMTVGGCLIAVLAGFAAYRLAEPLLRPAPPGRPVIRIGSKDFTEGHILTEILKQMLEAHTNLQVETRMNLGTSVILRTLQSGAIDLYPEYTGVLLTSKDALDLPVPKDRSTITEVVRAQMRRRHQLVLLKTFGLNNTYALCLRREVADAHRLRTISDLARVPQLRLVVDLSFLERPDGWRGLAGQYGLRFDTPPRQVSPDLLYRALEHREADVVVGFATDWQIEAQDLKVLEDDRDYFPSYHGAALVRAEVLERYPEVTQVLDRLHNQIDDRTMRRLNFQVAREKRSVAEVAGAFLRQQGLLAR